MADLTASSTEPTVLFNDTSGIGVDWRLRVDPNDEMHLQRYQSAGALWQDRFVVTNTEATLSGGAPTLVFSDTTTSAHDFRFRADGDTFYLEGGSSFNSLMEFTASGITARQNVKVSNTLPILTLENTTTDKYDFRLRNDGEFLLIEGGSSYNSLMEFTPSGITARQNVKVSNTLPVLTLENTTTDKYDFRLRNDGEFLLIEGGSSYNSLLEFSPTGITARQNLTISGTSPAVTLDPSSGTYNYSLASDGTSFQVNRVSGGTTEEAIGGKDRFLFAPRGIAAGHPSIDGSAQAFCAKWYTGLLTSTDIQNSYFQQRLNDDTSTAEWTAKTIGVIVMMSTTDTTTSTFQVSSWCAATAAANFQVQVLFGQSQGGGDLVKVTFDKSGSGYPGGARWRMIAFYQPT